MANDLVDPTFLSLFLHGWGGAIVALFVVGLAVYGLWLVVERYSVQRDLTMTKRQNEPRITVDGKTVTALEVVQKAVEQRGSDLKGKVFIITGSNGGIGFETARALVSQRATVILACRSETAMGNAVTELNDEYPPDEGDGPYATGIVLDLADLNSIRSFVDNFEAQDIPLHCLINNAAVGKDRQARSTKQGFQLLWGVNVLGTFLLTYLLLDKLKSSKPSRIVFLSSTVWKRGVFEGRAFDARSEVRKTYEYGDSKLAINLLARKLHRMLRESGVSVYTLHPGIIRTKLTERTIRASWKRFLVFDLQLFGKLKSTEQGAATTVYCATVPSALQDSGQYFHDCHVEQQHKKTVLDNENLQDTLWRMCEEYCGLCESHELVG